MPQHSNVILPYSSSHSSLVISLCWSLCSVTGKDALGYLEQDQLNSSLLFGGYSYRCFNRCIAMPIQEIILYLFEKYLSKLVRPESKHFHLKRGQAIFYFFLSYLLKIMLTSRQQRIKSDNSMITSKNDAIQSFHSARMK